MRGCSPDPLGPDDLSEFGDSSARCLVRESRGQVVQSSFFAAKSEL